MDFEEEINLLMETTNAKVIQSFFLSSTKIARSLTAQVQRRHCHCQNSIRLWLAHGQVRRRQSIHRRTGSLVTEDIGRARLLEAGERHGGGTSVLDFCGADVLHLV